MKRKNIFSVATVGLLSLLLVAGVATASTEWPGDNEFTGTVNFFKQGIKIGQQGTGGVTFFNGTIVNATTTDGANNPVTFGDNVRIDGRLQRGHNKEGDAWNVIVDDGLEVNKTLMVTGESTMKGKVKFEGGVEGIPTVDAYSKTQSDGRYVTKSSPTWDSKTGHASISRYAIGPVSSADAYFINTTDGAYLTGSGTMAASIQLPDGVTITRMSFGLIDGSSSSIIFRLFKVSNSNGVFTQIGTDLNSNDATFTFIEQTGLSEVVDNNNSSYLVTYQFSGTGGATLAARESEIGYTYTTPH